MELALGNTAAAREALTDMPPRKQDELDPVGGSSAVVGNKYLKTTHTKLETQ